ncbi:hypothetical protein K0M31_010725 [Melipona bicolor]|uniref:Uncharacterized protein n=1 Tax=Melipona bicolor TaxID=60889 RepID=A0AA40FL91_9HYME|nr:hypothetical protein K0M31_010725 [Melipona bicolor]
MFNDIRNKIVQQLDTKGRRKGDVLSERPSQFSADHGEDINSVYPRRATPKTDFIANVIQIDAFWA